MSPTAPSLADSSFRLWRMFATLVLLANTLADFGRQSDHPIATNCEVISSWTARSPLYDEGSLTGADGIPVQGARQRLDNERCCAVLPNSTMKRGAGARPGVLEMLDPSFAGGLPTNPDVSLPIRLIRDEIGGKDPRSLSL